MSFEILYIQLYMLSICACCVGIILLQILGPISRNKWTQPIPCCRCCIVCPRTPFLIGVLVLLTGELTSSSVWFVENNSQYTFCTSTSWFNVQPLASNDSYAASHVAIFRFVTTHRLRRPFPVNLVEPVGEYAIAVAFLCKSLHKRLSPLL